MFRPTNYYFFLLILVLFYIIFIINIIKVKTLFNFSLTFQNNLMISVLFEDAHRVL